MDFEQLMLRFWRLLPKLVPLFASANHALACATVRGFPVWGPLAAWYSQEAQGWLGNTGADSHCGVIAVLRF